MHLQYKLYNIEFKRDPWKSNAVQKGMKRKREREESKFSMNDVRYRVINNIYQHITNGAMILTRMRPMTLRGDLDRDYRTQWDG